MKATLTIITIALFASCSKIKPEKRCYTCSYVNSLQTEDFCGTEKELKQYSDFKKAQNRPIVNCR